ncbi:enoyl-CoA hydratase-related protein [Gordonia sp. Z-3]|uniref:enoyl-CoA hydratase-related protein n=1 Tax=Gordonia sp. Z-3 TaxID=3115408 RepID=UPI002E2D5FC2|nr:enoyl-CoA hydratase-related protein [Gordonia sp. Z-3]MED5802704.1 enoyl-CoA hydratase-related protein [Gordonia sp. Z-3]
MTEPLLVDVRDGAALVTLDRPQARNALSPDLADGLSAALRRLDADDAVRAIVLTGADPAFCAGLDLKSLAADGPAYLEAIRESNCIRLVGELATPVVGAVNGAAFTGEVVDAALALRIGLVTEVVAHEDLLGRAWDLARRIADADGEMMRSVKRIYDAGWDATTGAALDVEGELAAAAAPEWSALEANRQQVMARNRAQL